MDMMDSRYQLIRHRLGTRKTIFQDFRALTRYLVFDSWDDLLIFMKTPKISKKNHKLIKSV